MQSCSWLLSGGKRPHQFPATTTTTAEIALTVQDDGDGFDQANARIGLGTITMRTRAERIGGKLTVLSIPGMDTTVRVARAPQAQDEAEDARATIGWPILGPVCHRRSADGRMVPVLGPPSRSHGGHARYAW